MIDNLNKEQIEAVLTTEGPLLVIAGAGSGKTKVLTTRVAHILSENKCRPDEIIAITFTNKAAKEMKERVIGLLGKVAYDIQISTFHSFGVKFLRENAMYLGYDNKFTILDSEDALTVIKKIMKEKNIDPKKYNPKVIRSKISSSKNELITSSLYKKYINSEIDEIVYNIFSAYEKKLEATSSFDFDDLLLMPIKILEQEKEVLKHYQKQYKYILVDEYQDTNNAQYKLIKLLAQFHKNLCVVGDESQSIYSFRGANYRNILNFEKDYPNAKVILLERNYRSTKNILDAANDVIKNNKERKDKNLWTEKNDGEDIKYYLLNNEKEEASFVTDEIDKLIKSGVSRSDIAVLYRTNAQSRTIEEAILRKNIPYKVVGSFFFYKRKEIKDLISYLKFLHNQKDDESLERIINVPKRGIGLKTIENIRENSRNNNQTMFDAIESGKELEFKKMVSSIIEKLEDVSLTELVDLILDKTGIKESLTTEKTIESEIRLENLLEFRSITRDFEERRGIISLEDFLYEISLVSDASEYNDETDLVTLMTVHSAKGLEFKYLFIVGLEEGLFPHANSIMENEIEEERRLMYVAITRAMEKLVLTSSRTRVIFGETRRAIESRFLSEISAFEKEEIEDKKITPRYSINQDETYTVGEMVTHENFGEGIIIKVEKNILTIAFSNKIGIKKLMKGHNSIKKIKE